MATFRRCAITAGLAFAGLAAGAATAQTGAPDAAAIRKALSEAHAKYAGLAEGRNADYIPALAKVDSKLFGTALVTTDGQVFNSIVAVEQYKGRQMNPLVNPGAIATSGMVAGRTDAEKWAKILATHGDFAGRKLAVNQEVYESEAATNQRNQAIGALMHAYGLIQDDPTMVTDVYTRQCSIDVSAKDLAVMAGTLANGGKNPVTKKQVVSPENVPGILAVMATAGLYDDSGIWLYNVGLPGKSGVGGGLIAVSPGKFGIAAFSPPLDAAGNSVRAQRAIDYVSDRLGANPYASTPR